MAKDPNITLAGCTHGGSSMIPLTAPPDGQAGTGALQGHLCPGERDKAMVYFLNQWPKFTAIFDDGRIELGNDRIENAIRPLALERKNYPFAGSSRTAQNAAMPYSFFRTCKRQGTNSRIWLADTLQWSPDHSIRKPEEPLPDILN